MLCSLPSTCCLCRATTLQSLNADVISLHSTSTLTWQQNRCDSARFCAISLRHFCLLHTTSLSMFFTLCLLTTQTKSLPPSHKIVAYSIPFIITSTFAENVIQFLTSTPLRLAFTPPSLIDFHPTIPYFNFNYFYVIND